MAIFPRILLCFALQCILVNGDVLIATVPNLVRVGNNETVLVTIEKDTSNGEDIPVSVALKNDDNSIINEVNITTVEDRNKPVNYGIASMYIDPESIPSSGNPEISRYVTVTVTCDALGFSQNKRVLLNMEGGFFFIQTDKPIYNPDQSVKIRFISLNQKLTPLQQEMQFDIRTPQDVVVERKVIAPERNPSGLLVKVYKIPEEPMLGNWSIVAYYGKDLKLNRIVQFEVREYVLPTFYVEISPPSYILRSTRILSVTVNARYVYDQPVIGGSMLKIGLMDPDGEVEMKGSDIQSLAGGSALHAPDITAVLGENWYRDNVGHNLYLEASVWEGATGHFENASDISTKIVESGYIIGREKTLRYFKKGLPFPVKIDLKFPNGKIAPGVPVTLEAICHESNDVTTSILTQHNTDGEDDLQTTRSDLFGNIHFILYDTGECNEISVTITTNDSMLMVEGDPSMNSNARMTFIIQPYESPGGGNEYILIRPPGESDGTIGYGRRFSLEVIAITELSPLVHVYIISRGEIVHYDVTEVRRDGSNNIGGFTISATADMIPSSRIVAFFMGRDNNIIADSLKVEFQRECENRISVNIVSKDTVQATSLSNVEPQSNVFLKIYGKVGTSVSLVAVDKSILLLRDFHRLTKDKMYSAMDGHDVGCGPGGGRNSEEVFKNAGVTVMVSHGSLNVGEREGTYCVSDELSRRRRSLEDMLEKLDTDDLRKHFACKRGHRGIGSGSCEDKSERFLPFARRKFNIDDRELEKELVAIFIQCCEGEANNRGGSRDRSGDLFSTVFTEDVDIDTWRDTLIRKDFKESWAFIDVPIQSEGKAEFIQYTLPSSITTWSLQAFGLHHKYSMCVIDPVELVTSSKVFVQLKMPYSVIRNEHVEIQATVFYYPESIVDQPLKVRLFLKTPREVCSEGTPDVFSAEKRFDVNPNDAYTVSFVVIGVELGLWPISVGIVTSVKNEIVQKNLKVVAEGVERTFHHSVPLNPGEVRVRRRRRGIQTSEDCTWDDENGAQVSCLDITLPPTVIPGTESCHISLTGTRLGPAVTAVISNLGQWVNLPTGCGEQTMVGLAPNVYVLQYLIDTDSGTEEERSLALSHIDTGVAREMTYRLPDGSFSAHRNRPPSTWLTAFVAKVFCQASELTQVDSQISCGAIRWIVNYRQLANGLIHEETSVSNTALMGGLQGNLQAKIAMTAYALVAMTECSCDLEVNELPAARERAIAYLENELNGITQPYVLAMVTYALSLAGSERKDRANTKLKRLANEDPDSESRYWGPVIQTQGQPSWSQIQASALAIETTAYALLAQIELEEHRYAAGIADWLSQQQNYHGGFVSTQDTVTALQALAKFASVDTSQDLDLHCNISSPTGFTEILRVDNADHLLQLTTKVPKQKIGGELLVKTQGEGVGTLNVEVKYNVEADYTEICPFNMSITTTREGSSDDDSEMTFSEGDELSISIEVSYLGEFKTNMAIIDFGLFTGFIPDKESLEKVVTESSLVARYESSERSVVFYADYIPVQGETALRIEFKAVCQFKISSVYQAPVQVYDYYDPDKTCTKFYSADGSNTVDKLCIGDRCTCVSSECPSCDIEMSDSDLLDVACSSDETYVYQIHVTSVVKEGRYRLVNATIFDAIKKGHDQDLEIGDYRLFSLSGACRCPDIEIRKYFIMGKNTLTFSKPDGDTFTRGYRYVIDNETIVMRWKKNLHGTFRQNMRSGLSRCE